MNRACVWLDNLRATEGYGPYIFFMQKAADFIKVYDEPSPGGPDLLRAAGSGAANVAADVGGRRGRGRKRSGQEAQTASLQVGARALSQVRRRQSRQQHQ